jgi:hypothetical protein
MANISVEYLKPGMVLNSEVKDLSGRLLLGAGVEIAEKHIAIFRTWGITEVDVKGLDKKDVEPDALASIDPAAAQNIEKELSGIFSLTDREHPAIAELFRLCVSRKIRSLSQGASNGS